MNPNDPNVQMLDVVAQRLGDDLCHSLVFEGGAVAGLLITDPAQPAIRPTEDAAPQKAPTVRLGVADHVTVCIRPVR
jgi:hypothetical protein